MPQMLYSVKKQCELAVDEMRGHGVWEKIECDVYIDDESKKALPIICALKDGQIYEASGEKLQKMLDEYFPIQIDGTVELFRESLEEHRLAEAEHKAVWGEQSHES